MGVGFNVYLLSDISRLLMRSHKMMKKSTVPSTDPIQLNEININARNDDHQYAYTNRGGFTPEETANGAVVADVNGNLAVVNNELSDSAPILATRRPAYNQQRFDKQYAYEPPPTSPWNGLRRTARRGWSSARALCSVPYFLQWLLYEHFPMIDWVRHYNFRTMLSKDILSGITCGIMQVPQGMAFASLAGVGPEMGLYTGFLSSIVYSAFASSRHVSVSSFAVISMLTASVIKPNTEAVKQLLLARATRGQYVLPGTAFVTAAAAISNSSSVLTSSSTAATLISNATQVLSAAANHPLLLTIVDDEKFTKIAVMALSTSICLCVGLILLVFGSLRLGFISNYLSDALIVGFSCGAAVHIFTTQLFPAFGIKSSNPSGLIMLYYSYKDFFTQLPNTNLYTMGLSFILVAFLHTVKTYINGNARIMKKMYNIPIPSELIVVIVTIILSYFCNFPKNLNIKPVGNIPVGLIAPTVPDIEIAAMVFTQSIIVAFVAMALTIAIGRVLAKRNNTPLDPSTELRALGLANLAGSFYQCIPAGCAMARTMVLASIGAPTQLTNFIGSFIVFIIIQFLGKLLEPLPNAALAAIVIVAIKPLFMRITECWRLLRVSFVDASIYLVTLIAILLGEVGYGIVIGLAYSIFTVVIRTQYPHVYVLGRLRNTELYQPLGEYRSCAEIVGIRVLRIASPIYFANVEFLRTRLLELVFDTEKYRALATQKRSRRISQVNHLASAAGRNERLRKIAAANDHSPPNSAGTHHVHFVAAGDSLSNGTTVDLHGNSTISNPAIIDTLQPSSIVINDREPLTPKHDDAGRKHHKFSFRQHSASSSIPEENREESRSGAHPDLSVRHRKNSRKRSHRDDEIVVDHHRKPSTVENELNEISKANDQAIPIASPRHQQRQPKLSAVAEVEERVHRARPPRLSVVFAGALDEDVEFDNAHGRTEDNQPHLQLHEAVAPHHVILDCSSMTFVDTAGIAMLVDFVRDCRQKAQTQVFFAKCPRNVREQIRRNHSIIRGDMPDSCFFPTIHDAALFSMATARQPVQKTSSEADTLATRH